MYHRLDAAQILGHFPSSLPLCLKLSGANSSFLLGGSALGLSLRPPRSLTVYIHFIPCEGHLLPSFYTLNVTYSISYLSSPFLIALGCQLQAQSTTAAAL